MYHRIRIGFGGKNHIVLYPLHLPLPNQNVNEKKYLEMESGEISGEKLDDSFDQLCPDEKCTGPQTLFSALTARHLPPQHHPPRPDTAPRLSRLTARQMTTLQKNRLPAMGQGRQKGYSFKIGQPAPSHELDANEFDGFHDDNDDNEDSEVDEGRIDGLKKLMNALREDPRMVSVSLA